MAARIRFTSRGGTLIEVLVSLLIVTLVLSSVVEVSVYRRKAALDAQRTQKAIALAMAWQSGRLAAQEWTKGYEGGFPDQDGPRWVLEPAPQAQTTGSGLEPDGQWHQIRIVTTQDDVPGMTFLLRFDAVASGGGTQ
jgi:type II secretory pathway pseudopilin PulG